MVGLRAWACRIQGLRTRNLQQGLGSSVNCLAMWRLLWLLYPPLQGSHHWVTRPHPRIPQPLPSPTLPAPGVELGGNDRKELFPRLPLSASRTHFIFHTFDLFLSTWEGGQKSQALGIQVNVCPLTVKRFGEESSAGRFVSAAPDYSSPFTGIKSYCSDVHPLA